MADPVFERVAVLGIGLMGGSLGLAMKGRGLARHVVGYSRSADTRAQAVALGAADEAAASPEAAVAGADLVYLATPVDALLPTLTAIAPHLAAGCLVTDAGSAKAALVAAAEGLDLHGARFVGGHPMTGSEQMGIAAARADLFEGAAYAVTPTAHTEPEAVTALVDLARRLGARPVVLDPATHDRAVAAVSHLPHLLAAALVLATESWAEQGAPVFELAAGSWACGTRVAASGASLWREILLANRDAVAEAAALFQVLLDRLATAVAEGDGARLEEALSRAREIKQHHPGRSCPSPGRPQGE